MRRLWGWLLLPPEGTALRDVTAAVLIGQGVVRLVDGALFVVQPIRYGDPVLYALVLLGVGAALAATRTRRATNNGAFAAAAASVLYIWLAVSVMTATSAVASLIYAWGMFVEARAASRWDGRGTA